MTVWPNIKFLIQILYSQYFENITPLSYCLQCFDSLYVLCLFILEIIKIILNFVIVLSVLYFTSEFKKENFDLCSGTLWAHQICLLIFFNYEKFTLLFFQIFLSLCFYILFFWISCLLDPSTFVLSSYLLTLFLYLLFLFLSHFPSWRVLQFYLQISNLFLICRISSKMLSVVFLISTILSPEQIFLSDLYDFFPSASFGVYWFFFL